MRVVAHDRAPRQLAISARDARIITLAIAKLHGARVGFADALRALTEAVEESIPAGRVFLLGNAESGPIVGSIISQVGIVESLRGIDVVRVQRGGGYATLRRLEL